MVKKNFIKHWPLILAGVILTSFITCAGISIKCKPTEKEKVMVFAASGTIDVGTFVKECNSVKEEYIREIDVKHGYTNLDSTKTLFGMVYSYCDFYIFPESWTERIKPLALTFDEPTINSLIPNSTGLPLLNDGENNYGIKIYDKVTGEGKMKSIIKYSDEIDKENYYILFRKTSLHIKGFTDVFSDNALKMVNKILSL